MSRLVVLAALLLALSGCATGPGTSSTTDTGVDDGALYRDLLPATATVLKDGRIAGGGAFVTRQGLFLTAAHVVYQPEDRIELLLPGGRRVPARTIAIDMGNDLALLETGLGTRSAGQWLQLRATRPPPGTPIYLISAPSMLREVFLTGRVSRDRLGFNYLKGRKSYVHSLMVSANAIPGTSGGCWVDAQGRIVGVQSAQLGGKDDALGLAFIASGPAIKRLIDSRRDYVSATLGAEFVGLYTQGYGYNKRFPKGTSGVAIHKVFEGGPTAKAGIPVDYLILRANGRPTADVDALLKQVRLARPGQAMRLTVMSPDNHVVKAYDVWLGALVW